MKRISSRNELTHDLDGKVLSDIGTSHRRQSNLLPNPSELWRLIRHADESSLVHLLGTDCEIRTFPHEALGSEIPQYNTIYGLDAGSTGAVSVRPGLTLCKAEARFGVVRGEQTLRHPATSTIAHTSHSSLRRSRFDISSYRPDAINKEIGANVGDGTASYKISLPNPEGYGSSRGQYVGDIAQHLAEAIHLQRTLPHLDGTLAFDGGLYPLKPASQLVFEESRAEAQEWQSILSLIIRMRARSIQTQLEDDREVFAVSKTQKADAVINSLLSLLKSKGSDVDADQRLIGNSLPYQSDRKFFNHLLQDAALGGNESAQTTGKSVRHRTWAVTPWLVQSTIHDSQGVQKHPFDLIESVEELDRAYFFVYVPGEEAVFRIESPRRIVEGKNGQERRRQQLKIIREMAGRDSPEPIQRADQNASIGYDGRQEFIRRVQNHICSSDRTTGVVPDYNGDVRWGHLHDG